jgi:hypothetical protein
VEVSLSPGCSPDWVEVGGGWPYDSPIARERSGNGDMWQLSNVITRMKVAWDGGSETISFDRDRDRGVTKKVRIPRRTSRIRFQILAVSRGTGGNNVCLDGVRLLSGN